MDSRDNPVLQAIRERRSIRKFTADPVDRQTLTAILEAGQWAPSGKNNQPWRFLVVTRDDPRMEKLAACTRYAPIVRSSAACICVFLAKDAMYSEMKDHQGAGACLQNMLLAVHALGLGAVWLGQIVNDQPTALSALGLSGAALELEAVLALGHPDQKGGSKRKPLSELMLEDFLMDITTFPLGALQTNCFVLGNGKEAVAVDPGGDPAPVLEHLKAGGLTLTAILNTHLHFDHTGGNKALSEATGAPILANDADACLLDTWLGKGGDMGLPPIAPYEWTNLGPGEAVFAGMPCSVFHTPGHSPGSLTFYFPDAGAAFVGDLIFYRSIGRTDFPGGDLDALKRSVREHIFTLPPETRLLSGHGPETSVGDEQNHNPFFGGY